MYYITVADFDAALAPHGPKAPRHGGKLQFLDGHGAAGRLPVAAGKAPVAHALALGPLERQRNGELARRRHAARSR